MTAEGVVAYTPEKQPKSLMQRFDLTRALPTRTSSNTQRAYYRWIDRYLVDQAGLKATHGDFRIERMQQLPVKLLRQHLTADDLRRWLDTLVAEGHGRQSLDQARAAIVTLAELMAQAKLLSDEKARKVREISVPPIARNDAPATLLSNTELQRLIIAARDMATSHNQMLRNNVVASMLCTMALRREELSMAKWGDIALIEGKIVLVMQGGDTVPIQRNVLNAIDRWRSANAANQQEVLKHSALIRRIWKGGRIAREGLSPDGVWLIIRDAARYANLGHVTPDDLRRSAAVGLREKGVEIEEISRLLRHRNVTITERFLAKIPKPSAD
jgi:site-specific recombinase XerD